MKIGLCYDVKEDYGFNSLDYTYCNFTDEETISYVKNILESCGYEVSLIGNHLNLYNLLTSEKFDSDIVFSTAEGYLSRNREAWIPTLLEIGRIPFVGMDAYGLSLTLDKVQTKLIANHLNIPTPEFYEIFSTADLPHVLSQLAFPLIIKPYREGDSMGVHLVTTKEELENKAMYLFQQYNQKLICERYIPFKEIAVSVCEIDGVPHALGLCETRGKDSSILPVFTSEYKLIYGSKKITPSVSLSTKKNLTEYSLKLFKYTECHEYCRFDFRLDYNEKVYFLEMTPLAALGPNASFLSGITLNGIKPEFVFDSIIKNACQRYNLLPPKA